jgi:hypothetical protein
MNVEVTPVLLLTTSSFGLNVSIVAAAALFKTRSSSALLMVSVIDFPLITHVPRIVPVTPCPSVLLMKPGVAPKTQIRRWYRMLWEDREGCLAAPRSMSG